jgi:hypothetical protein
MIDIYKPLGIDVKEIIEEPSDLLPLLIASEQVVRFENPHFPKGIIVDNTRQHTHRMRCIVKGLFGGSSRLDRMCLIHDLSEPFAFGLVDISIVAKNYMTERELIAIENSELAAAHLIFTPSDLAIFKDFLNAESFLRGVNINPSSFSKDGIDTNFTDKGEGNMYAHFHLARWAASPDFDPAVYEKNHPMLIHAFNQYDKYMQRLDLYESLGGDGRDARQVFVLQMECIKGWWEGLGERIPQEVRDRLFIP